MENRDTSPATIGRLRPDQLLPTCPLYGRVVNIMSHGNYSFYDPVEMLKENREHFEKALDDFLAFYPLNRVELPGADA